MFPEMRYENYHEELVSPNCPLTMYERTDNRHGFIYEDECALAGTRQAVDAPFRITTPKPVRLGRPPIDEHMRQYNMFEASLRAGGKPLLGNGFRAALYYPPQGDRLGVIPDLTFTMFFARQEVPAASPNSSMFGHDIGHLIGYKIMCSKPIVANLVQQAAATAVQNGEVDCKLFAGAVDELSSRLAGLADFYQATPHHMKHARTHIETLLVLAGEDRAPQEISAWRAAVEAELGFDAYDAEARKHVKGSWAQPRVAAVQVEPVSKQTFERLAALRRRQAGLAKRYGSLYQRPNNVVTTT